MTVNSISASSNQGMFKQTTGGGGVFDHAKSWPLPFISFLTLA